MSGGIMIGFPEMLGIIAALLVGILIYRRPHSIRRVRHCQLCGEIRSDRRVYLGRPPR
jgi:hypothetical protein